MRSEGIFRCGERREWNRILTILIQLEPSSRTFVQRRLRELVVVLVEKLVLYILLYIC